MDTRVRLFQDNDLCRELFGRDHEAVYIELKYDVSEGTDHCNFINHHGQSYYQTYNYSLDTLRKRVTQGKAIELKPNDEIVIDCYK